MENKLISLYEDNVNISRLIQTVDRLSKDDVLHVVEDSLHDKKTAVTRVIKALIKGCPCDKNDRTNMRLYIYKTCLRQVECESIQSKVVSDVINLLESHVSDFPAKYLIDVSDYLVELVKTSVPHSGKSLELLPTLVSTLCKTDDKITHGCSEATGLVFKSTMINTLCSSKWEPQWAVHIAKIFRDILISADELQFLIDKILRTMAAVTLQELPSLIYQLLLLSTKGQRKMAIEGIISFFAVKDKNAMNIDSSMIDDILREDMCTEELGQVEGTVLLHLSLVMKQDQELGREFIKFLKTGLNSCSTVAFSPFSIAMALSLSGVHRFQETVFDTLKSAVMKSFKDANRQEVSKWTRDMISEPCTVGPNILQTLTTSVHGWDHVVEGLVHLGFILMDTWSPKSTLNQGYIIPAGQQCCNLGAEILLKTFKLHEMARTAILEQILNRIITKANTPVYSFICLLSAVVLSAPQIVLDSLNKVKESLDYLVYLPLSTASGLMKAVQPLMKISMPLRDSLMLVLRKAMFSRQIEARKIAATGYLQIMIHFKIRGSIPCSQSSEMSISCSQVQADVHVNMSSATSESMCYEILGNLRRSLTQQADVRLLVYEGLYEVLCKNSQLSSMILNLLLQQMKQYYEPDEDILPPVRLGSCTTTEAEQTYLSEPLAHLIKSILLCMVKVKSLDEDTTTIDLSIMSDVDKFIGSVTLRMARCEMDDFSLDKSADFSTTTVVGLKNSIHGILVMGWYESLISYLYERCEYRVDIAENILQLYNCYNKLYTVMKEKATNNAARKGRNSGQSGSVTMPTIKSPKSLLSLSVLTKMLYDIYSDKNVEHTDFLQLLQNNQDFTNYIISTTTNKLTVIHEEGIESWNNRDGLYSHLCIISRLFLDKFVSQIEIGSQQVNARKGKPLSELYLEGVYHCISITCKHFHDQIEDFLHKLSSSQSSPNTVPCGKAFLTTINRLQRLVISILENDKESKIHRSSVVLLLNLITTLSQHQFKVEKDLQQLYQWLLKLATEYPVDDTVVCRTIVSSMLHLNHKTGSTIKITRDLCHDIHSHLGDIDPNVEVEQSNHFAIVCEKTASTVFAVLVAFMEKDLNDIEWVVVRMKALLAANGTDHVDFMEHRVDIEKSVCKRLRTMIGAFHEMVQSTVPLGQSVEHCLKTLMKFYETLTQLVKYSLSLYTQRVGTISGSFEKLVKLSGTHLTHNIYTMITDVQIRQSEQFNQQHTNKQQKNKKVGKKTSDISQETVAAAGKTKVMKQCRPITNLVFAIEQYERYLIQLSKKSKVNLMEHIKLSTSRDFRINLANLDSTEEKENEGSTDDDTEVTAVEEDAEVHQIPETVAEDSQRSMVI